MRAKTGAVISGLTVGFLLAVGGGSALGAGTNFTVQEGVPVTDQQVAAFSDSYARSERRCDEPPLFNICPTGWYTVYFCRSTDEYGPNIAWGDGTTSIGTPVSAGGGGSSPTCHYTVRGMHTYALAGAKAFSVTGVPGAPHEGTATVTDAPLNAHERSFAASEGVAFTGVVARLSDDNPLAQASNYTVSIDWGDGSTSAGSVAPDATGEFLISGTHTYTTARSFTVTVTVVQVTGSNRATVNSSASVVARPPVPTTPVPGAPPDPALIPEAAECEVPALKGKTLRGARRALEAAHCALGKVTRRRARRVKPGRVIRQVPAAGTLLAEGSRVAVLVSKR